MKTIKTFITFFASAALCLAQAVNISGVVRNSEGSGIGGVTVRLGKADTATTTGSDGSFRLAENPTGVNHTTDHADIRNDCPFRLRGDRLFFTATEQTDVKVQIYDGNGRLLMAYDKPAASEQPSMALPHLGSGIGIYRISVNNEQYAFTAVAGIAPIHGTAAPLTVIAPVKRAKSTEQFDDALLFTREGYRLYRLAITKPDTSGLQITLTPTVTGTVTDAEGNVYKTVRIGNQEWTAENLRTTKYNDNTAITQGTSGAAYSFYKNTTDAAAKKKWGAFYSFAAVKTGKLAPTGWHVSTDADWDTLQIFLMANGYNYDGTVSVLNRGTSESDDNKIAKSLSAKTDWTPTAAGIGATGAIGNDLSKNDASGFSALPGRYRSFDGDFYDQGNFAFFWTATEHDASYAWYRFFWSVSYDISRGDRVKTLECSVRLVRNR